MKVSKRSQNFHFGWIILLRQDSQKNIVFFILLSVLKFWHILLFRVAERKHPNNFYTFYLFASIHLNYNTYFKGNLLKMNTYSFVHTWFALFYSIMVAGDNIFLIYGGDKITSKILTVKTLICQQNETKILNLALFKLQVSVPENWWKSVHI